MPQQTNASLAEEPQPAPKPIHVRSTVIITGSVFNRATLTFEIDGKNETFMNDDQVVTSGPIEAMCLALHSMFPRLECVDYTVKSQGKRSNAVAKAYVQLGSNGKLFAGDGEDRNTLVATAKAIANALDKLRFDEYKNPLKPQTR